MTADEWNEKKKTDGQKYEAFIIDIETRLGEFKKRIDAVECGLGGHETYDEKIRIIRVRTGQNVTRGAGFKGVAKTEAVIRRHRSFLPLVKDGLLPASDAIRFVVEGKSAETGGNDGDD